MAPAAKKVIAVKRSAQDAKAPKTKQAKVDPALQPVIEAIHGATELTATCRQMLLAMLGNTLCVPSDKRDAAQVRVVEMIREVMDTTRERLQKNVATEEANVASLDCRRDALTEACAQADERTAAKAHAVATGKATVAEFEHAVAATASSLAATKESQQAGDEMLEASARELEDVTAALKEHFTALNSEIWQEECTRPHLEVLVATLKRSCGKDETLVVTVPQCFSKAPSDRGDFDKMVIEQVEKCLTGRATELESVLEAGAGAKSERAAAVEAADRIASEAAARRRAAADDFFNLQVESENAIEAARVAGKEIADLDLELKSAAKALDVARAGLQRFLDHNVAGFEMLRSMAVPSVAEVGEAPVTVALAETPADVVADA